MINRRMSQHRHPEKHSFQLAIVAANFNIVSGQQQCLYATEIPLFPISDRIQVHIDKYRDKLKGETL